MSYSGSSKSSSVSSSLSSSLSSLLSSLSSLRSSGNNESYGSSSSSGSSGSQSGTGGSGDPPPPDPGPCCPYIHPFTVQLYAINGDTEVLCFSTAPGIQTAEYVISVTVDPLPVECEDCRVFYYLRVKIGSAPAQTKALTIGGTVFTGNFVLNPAFPCSEYSIVAEILTTAPGVSSPLDCDELLDTCKREESVITPGYCPDGRCGSSSSSDQPPDSSSSDLISESSGGPPPDSSGGLGSSGGSSGGSGGPPCCNEFEDGCACGDLPCCCQQYYAPIGQDCACEYVGGEC